MGHVEATLFTDLAEGKVHSTRPQNMELTLPRPTGLQGQRAALCESCPGSGSPFLLRLAQPGRLKEYTMARAPWLGK